MAATTDVPQCVVWGRGRYGRLGDGDGSEHCHSDVIPFNVGGANVASAAVGDNHRVGTLAGQPTALCCVLLSSMWWNHLYTVVCVLLRALCCADPHMI